MFIENEISIYDFVCSISEGFDLVNLGIDSHHARKKFCSPITTNVSKHMKIFIN